MSLVMAQGLGLSYGKRTLFSAASFSIGPTDRIGLVGANGTGKSSLLKILVGQVTPDTGTLTFRRGMRAGYLPQELSALPEGSLVESVMSTVPGRDSLDQRLREVEEQLASAEGRLSPDDQLELAGELTELHEEREHFDAHFGRHRAAAILLGLGFSADRLGQDTRSLSGGWRMRAALAGLLLQDPDLLLLDEPTNHLDLPSMAWFDSFLRRARKAVVLISHDRAFLNRQISRVISLEPEGLRCWTGDYEDYQRLRAEEAERLLATAERQAAKRAQLEAFVNRFRAKASKASQAQSKLKQLERMETVEVHQARDTVSFRFPSVQSSGREVARFRQVRKAFGSNVVYEGLDAQLLRGQRVAVVGPNGAGKTTLLKLLAGELEPDSGEISFGHNVVCGYYAQHHAETLGQQGTVLSAVAALVPEKPTAWVRSVLGSFLFSGDDVDKPLRVLSGGERARVALARLLVLPANLLLMDEPTNHLDLDSSEALIEALEAYEGTLFFVSHNRSFLNSLATQIWDVRNRGVAVFPGNLDDYLHHLELEAGDGASAAQGPAVERRSGEKERRRAEAEARQARSQATASLRKEIAALEARIAALESAQREREAQLADPGTASDFSRSRPLMEGHRLALIELEALLERWERANQELAVVLATVG